MARRIPHIDGIDKFNFVVNYFMQGCTPPFWLFIETAQEPAFDLLLLLLEPDMQDIVQAMFEPGGSRKRRSGRHGRKSGRKIGFPDTSDIVGAQIRARVNPHDALRFGPVKFLFKMNNVYEGVAFSAAVLDGVIDVGFEGILGVMTLRPDLCPGFGFFQSTNPGGDSILAIVQPWCPINLWKDETQQGFQKPTGYNVLNTEGDYTVAFHCIASAYPGDRVDNMTIALLDGDGNVRAIDGPWDIPLDGSRQFDLTAEFQKGEMCVWVGRSTYGNAFLYSLDAFGFEGTWG